MADQPYETRDNSGSLFPEKDRKTENHPHFTGKCSVGGEETQISAWKKVSRAGNSYLSLSFRKWKKEPREGSEGPEPDDVETPFDF